MNRRILLILSALLLIGLIFFNGDFLKRMGDKILGNELDPVEKVQNLCPDCKGEGRLPCPRCNATGKVAAYGGVPCGQCNGAGKIRCEKCKGRGKIIK